MPSATNPQQNATVLVVDDDANAGERLRGMFEKAGYRALSAADTTSALRLLQTESCDLVVVDLALSEVDGLAFCRLLRAQPATSKLPVIGLSDDDSDSQKQQAFAAGADECIAKSSSTEIVSRSAAHLRAAQREWELIDSNRELRFLADLGRGLLRTLELDQLVNRVAGATYEGTSAAMCAAFISLGDDSEAACVFDREGSAEGIALLHADRLKSWLTASTSSSVAPLLISEPNDFLLRDEAHRVEYAAPLRFGGRPKGALIVAFDKREDCDDTVCRLVDAAAQQAALAAHISSLYQAARAASANLTIEVERRTAEVQAQRRFIEAIIDSLPLSLYAVDRNFEIVAWNRNRELGELGIPRGSVLGKSIFGVLTRQKRELLESEFARVFASGEIQRLENTTALANGELKHWLIRKVPMWIDRSSEAFRCKTITNGPLDFSHTRSSEHILVNLADVIASAARLLSHQQRGELIKFQIETPNDLPLVAGDAGQLQQAVIALATNAIDAMPDGGVLKIGSRRDGNSVLVEVSDTGVGIPQQNITRIFEPFFTTKEIGKGTGLGLAVCYGILTEHEGSLDVQSTPGVGTTFTISLPAINSDGETQA